MEPDGAVFQPAGGERLGAANLEAGARQTGVDPVHAKLLVIQVAVAQSICQTLLFRHGKRQLEIAHRPFQKQGEGSGGQLQRHDAVCGLPQTLRPEGKIGGENLRPKALRLFNSLKNRLFHLPQCGGNLSAGYAGLAAHKAVPDRRAVVLLHGVH